MVRVLLGWCLALYPLRGVGGTPLATSNTGAEVLWQHR